MSPILLLFLFKQKTAYEMRISDWSSDVCSSDLRPLRLLRLGALLDRGVLAGRCGGAAGRRGAPRNRPDPPARRAEGRSEERRVGQGCDRTDRERRSTES